MEQNLQNGMPKENSSELMVFGEENPFSDFFDNFDIKTLHESKEIQRFNLSVTIFTIVYSIIFVVGIILNGLAIFRLIRAKQFSMLSQVDPRSVCIYSL